MIKLKISDYFIIIPLLCVVYHIKAKSKNFSDTEMSEKFSSKINYSVSYFLLTGIQIALS